MRVLTGKDILNTIKSNERFNKIARLHKILTKHYGPIVIAGGSMVDCFYDRDFYDVDIFINVNDLNPKFRKEYKKDSRILDVLRARVNGEAIDIIVVNYSVQEHISRFDQNFKKIWYDGRLNIAPEAVRDIRNNEISLGSFNGPVVFFRCLKSAMKYNMTINKEDYEIMHNYLSFLGDFKVAAKYEDYKHLFKPNATINSKLAVKTKVYSKQYWDLSVDKLPSFKEFKKQINK